MEFQKIVMNSVKPDTDFIEEFITDEKIPETRAVLGMLSALSSRIASNSISLDLCIIILEHFSMIKKESSIKNSKELTIF